MLGNKKSHLTGIIGGLLLSLAAIQAQAAVYVYQLPDGSRVISDHALSNPDYKLVRSTQNITGVGILAAARTPQLFRTRTDYYDRLIRRMAVRHDVDPALVKAVMHVESAFNPYATSHKGASGLLQLMPETAAHFGVTDIYDPVQNVRAGVMYLRQLLDRYNNKSRLVLAAYNAGPSAVERYKGIPPFNETRSYVKKVLRYKKRYAVLAKSDI